MPKWIGQIDVMGPSAIVIQAETEEKAREILYQFWLEECENQNSRELHPYSEELANDLEAEEI